MWSYQRCRAADKRHRQYPDRSVADQQFHRGSNPRVSAWLRLAHARTERVNLPIGPRTSPHWLSRRARGDRRKRNARSWRQEMDLRNDPWYRRIGRWKCSFVGRAAEISWLLGKCPTLTSQRARG